MKHKNQYILSLLMLLNLHVAIAQESNTESDIDSQNWQEEFNDQAVKNKFKTLEAPPSFISDEESKNWWELFGYDRLNGLVALALKENNRLKIAQSQTGEAREEIKLAKASQFPTVSLNPSFSRQEFSGNRPMPFDGPVERVTYNTYALPLDLAYEVDVSGRIKNNVKAAQLNYKASSAAQDAATLNVAAEATRYFILLLMLDSEEQVYKSTQKSREDNLEIVKIRYEAGLTNEIDLQRAKTELSSVTVQIKDLEIERRNIELTLATICGQPANSFTVETKGIKYSVPSVELRDTTAIALSRPDLKAAGFAVGAKEEQTKAARKDLYPSLYLSGSTGLLSGESDQVFDGDSRNWLLGATLSVPIFEGGRRRARVNISEYQLERSISNLNQSELEAYQELEREKYNIVKLSEQIVAQQEFLAASQRAATLSHYRYRKGLVTYLEVVDAERIVLEAERLSIQLLGQQLLKTVDLIVATGGNLSMFDRVED